MNALVTRYHHTKGLPADVDYPRGGVWLRYTSHATRRALERLPKAVGKDLVAKLPRQLPAEHQLIGVDTFAGKAVTWLVRFPLTEEWDAVLALGWPCDYPSVKTVYINHRSDNHATLRAECYAEMRGA